MAAQRMDAEVATTVVGSGEPSLLFVHGFGCASSDWHAQVSAFRTRHRVIAADLPGHGASTLPPQASFDTLADALLQVRRKHGGPSVILVGHSLGCRVILEALARGCEGVRALVLIEQNIVGGENAHERARQLDEVIAALGVHAFLRPAFHAMFNESGSTSLRELVLARLGRLDADFAQRLLLDSIRWEANEAGHLARLRLPVLLIQSTYLDESFTWHRLKPGMSTPWTRLVQREVPGAQLQIISGPGHFVQIEAAATVNRHIREFVADLGYAP